MLCLLLKSLAIWYEELFRIVFWYLTCQRKEGEELLIARAHEKIPEKQEASWNSNSAVVLKICFIFWEEQENILFPKAERHKQVWEKQS